MTAEQLKASLITYAMKGGLSASWRKEHNYSFELWRNLPLSKICHTMTYGTARKSSSEGDVVVIRMGNLQGGEIIWSKLAYTTARDDIEKYLLSPGDILFNRTNSPELVGKTSIYRGERPAIYAGYLIRLDYDKNIIIGEYLNYVMNSQEERQFCADVRVNGVCQANINAKKIGAFSIPVPPINEQQYIVSCLNELLPLVEEYGKSQSALHVLETELPGKLRASLLQQAIMGKLVPQLDDEPAVDIDAEEPEEVPFAIPEKWKWVRLRDIGAIFSGATPKTNVTEYWSPAIVPWVTPADLGKNKKKTISCGERSISKKGYLSCSAVLLPKGSVVYSSRAPIGHIAITENELATNQGCKSIAPNFEIVLSEYVYYGLIALTPDIQSRASGTTFLEISSKKFGETFFPLPPLAEQRRIITRLNELLPYLNSMIKN